MNFLSDMSMLLHSGYCQYIVKIIRPNFDGVWNSKNKVTCIEFNDQAILGTKTCVHLIFYLFAQLLPHPDPANKSQKVYFGKTFF